MALAKSQRSLKAWSKQKWRTKSGKKSSVTGERYLPEKAIKSLSAQEYAASTRRKREAKRKGKQFSKQPKGIARKTRAYRSFSWATKKRRRKKMIRNGKVKKIKKVIKGLNKASGLHAKQAKTLKSVISKNGRPKSRNGKKA